ncbi:MAG: hypothetical protein Q7R73_00230 [bacterium]|nr:hypothetical protein [bacterium]
MWQSRRAKILNSKLFSQRLIRLGRKILKKLRRMSYFMFNILEAAFWVGLGCAVLLLRNIKIGIYRQLAIFAFFIFLLFGVSDVLEIYVGNFFEPEMYWLLVWKVLNVIAIIGVFIWYFVLRLRREI